MSSFFKKSCIRVVISFVAIGFAAPFGLAKASESERSEGSLREQPYASAQPASVERRPAAPSAPAQTQSEGWTVTIKGNVGMAPTWEGSKNLAGYILPGLSIRRAGTLVSFAAPDDSLAFALFDEGWMKIGVAGKIRGPRHQTQYTELRGIHDIDWTLEAGGFAEFWATDKIRGRVEVRQGFMGHHGVVADFYADWVEKDGPWTVALGPRLSVASSAFMNKFYGVTPLESLVNKTVGPYQPSGGIKSIGVTASVAYQWNEQWMTSAYVRYNRLVGAAASSPLVSNLGSKNQVIFGAIVAYSFDWAGLKF